jgi:hypothetical protein
MRHRIILALGALILLGMQSANLQTHTTAYFKIKSEKGVSSKEVAKFGTMLEADYEKYKKLFGVKPQGIVNVMYYTSPERIQRESKIPLFDDGVWAGGKIYVSKGHPLDGKEMKGMVARVTARCVLNGLRTCPRWLAECYSLHAGNEEERFGAPVRSTMVGFEDLAEDMSRAETSAEFREVYAKLGATAAFFVERYGETKFESLFAQLKSGKMFEEAAEGTFGEKIGVIEQAWSKALAAPPK